LSEHPPAGNEVIVAAMLVDDVERDGDLCCLLHSTPGGKEIGGAEDEWSPETPSKLRERLAEG
jgi:hypothetical protein